MKKYPLQVRLESVSCPNCKDHNDEFVLVGRDRIHNIEGEFTVLRCKNCGLERTNPRPTQETIGVYYPASYAPYHSKKLKSNFLITLIKKTLSKILFLDDKVLPKIRPGRMLEVGCSSGVYMEHARNLGWIVDGIEFSEEASRIARLKGFDVQTCALEQANSPASKYNMIVAWMVVEHLHQPIESLKKLRQWIDSNGMLVGSVPSSKSLAKTLFNESCYDLHLPNHLYHFNPKTLELTLSNSGWKLERIKWQKNSNTLLWSFQYWTADKNYRNLERFACWLRIGKFSYILRLSLGVLLGLTHQSGRVVFWASPK